MEFRVGDCVLVSGYQHMYWITSIGNNEYYNGLDYEYRSFATLSDFVGGKNGAFLHDLSKLNNYDYNFINAMILEKSSSVPKNIKVGDKVYIYLFGNSVFTVQYVSNKMANVVDENNSSRWVTIENIIPIEGDYIANNNINNKKNMNIKNTFISIIKKEPQKSFLKAGITNNDGFLTEDGQSIFSSWLLEKFGSDFKKEVVNDILEEKKSN